MQYWCHIRGSELYGRVPRDEHNLIMHNLRNTVVTRSEQILVDSKIALYPVRIQLSKTKHRTMYFEKDELAEMWFLALRDAAGLRDINEAY